MNDGWKVAHTTLAHERGVVINNHLGIRRDIEELIELAKITPIGARTAAQHDVVRHRLVDLYVRGEIMSFMADQMTATQLSGKNPGIETALGRFLWQDLTQEIPELRATISDQTGMSAMWPGYGPVPERTPSPVGRADPHQQPGLPRPRTAEELLIMNGAGDHR